MKEKHIRDSFLIYRSSSRSSAVEGVDADSVFLDEYDRVGAQAEDSAVQSMSSSQFKYLRRFSTPTTPGYGIHKEFMKSDMKYYMHECGHCGYLNELKYAPYKEPLYFFLLLGSTLLIAFSNFRCSLGFLFSTVGYLYP